MRGLRGLLDGDMTLDEGQAREEGLCSIDSSFEALDSVRECLDIECGYVPASCHWSSSVRISLKDSLEARA